MIITNISEAKAQLSRLIERVNRGEEVVIGKAGRPIAKLVPYRADTSPRLLDGVWAGRIKIDDDFDELPEEVSGAFTGGDESPA